MKNFNFLHAGLLQKHKCNIIKINLYVSSKKNNIFVIRNF